MSDSAWDYYCRHDPRGEPSELYRLPTGPQPAMQRLGAKQRLRKGLFWLDAGDDTGIANDLASGWFDFDGHRLSETQAAALIEDWAHRAVWPGRP